MHIHHHKYTHITEKLTCTFIITDIHIYTCHTCSIELERKKIRCYLLLMILMLDGMNEITRYSANRATMTEQDGRRGGSATGRKTKQEKSG